MKKKDNTGERQVDVSLLDIIDIVESSGKELSLEELSQVIAKLQAAKRKVKQREVIEQKQKEQEEIEKAKAQEKMRIESIKNMDLPLDWENVFNCDERTQGVHVEDVADGLVMSLTQLGRVDIEYISSITAQSCKSVITALKGSIFQNPEKWEECFYKGWETAEEYLSGNLMRKLKVAREFNKKFDGYFKENVDAIRKVVPIGVDSKDIYVTLGSPWVPADIIDEFITHILGSIRGEFTGTWHDEITGAWEINNKYQCNGSVRSTNTYGTKRMEALYILEKTLNMRTIAVKDEVSCPANASGVKRVVNEAETISALEKQAKMIKEFQRWVWKDEKRRDRLEEIFQDKYGCIRRRIFDGSFLKFPTMSKDIELYPYQKNAVARIIFTPNTLLAHDVGSGKTYVMIAAGMELLRMGLSKKNLFVVPNNIIGQWKDIFLSMYPGANLLIVEPKNFKPEKREVMLKKIRDEKFDGIIMAYSCFEQIPLSKDYYRETLLKQKEIIHEAAQKRGNYMTAQLRKCNAIDNALKELNNALDEAYDTTIYFDDLGITRMFVDEAHNFKNVPFDTKMSNELGINSAGSKKCKDMMDKVCLIQKNNKGGGVVMATGTPITNSITDAFIMQKYLQSGELALLDLQNFDGWVGMFAERNTEFEIDVDTNSYRMATRFSKFHNLPELNAILSSIADFHQVDQSAGIPFMEGYKDAVVPKTAQFAQFLDEISTRADAVRNWTVSRDEDNMLKITADGRKAALDFRLVDDTAKFTPNSKVARCVENVVDIYFRTYNEKSTQLVFCDTSTPKVGFNIYDEMKRLLLNNGIPESAIAYIHSADTDAKRAKLFKSMNDGEVRILIGSTFKLGLGVNVQKKLVALHHLDVPWRPADMTQREGRILRQGNENKKVYIYRYITEGSFDAYSWQLLETKARFIADLLSGSITQRSGSDIDGTALNYAEVKALAIGNPLVKERVEVYNRLGRLMTLQRKTVEGRLLLENESMELPVKIGRQIELIGRCERDIAFYKYWQKSHPVDENQEQKKRTLEEKKILRERLHTAVMDNILETAERQLFDYRGFTIVLPANMTLNKPFVFLKREGKYIVELGDTEVGNLQRIINFLDAMDEHLEKLKKGLENFEERKRAIEIELKKDENYLDDIEKCKKQLEKIDKQLKVDKNE